MTPIQRLGLGALFAAGLGLSACAYNETLGRNQFLLVDDSALTQQSNAVWQQTLQTKQVSTNAAQLERVRRVGGRIVQAANLNNRAWEYAVFVDTSPNAFVLPTGQIGVTTGLLSLVQNDDQLATVIGHEVGHVVARHAAERYSTQAASQFGIGAAQQVAGQRAHAIGALGGLGAQYGLLLPFSRAHELEADRLGIDYMAGAGYSAPESVRLWQIMASQRQGSNPEFASTHPSDQSRIAALQDYMARRGLN